MQMIVCVLLVLWCFVSSYNADGNIGPPSKSPHDDQETPEEQWFTQRKDHFNPRKSATFLQRYYVNDKYYKTGGPVFLMSGGATALDPKWITQGAWIEYAKEVNALCFLLENRFFGKSHAADDLSIENLGPLNTEGTVGDLARFIGSMNRQYNLTEDTKWIGFGGSYGGTLIVWLKTKYPHLLHGGVVSSAPLLQEASFDFDGYYKNVEETLSSVYSEECAREIRSAINQTELISMNESRRFIMNEIFNLCDPLEGTNTSQLDFPNLYSIIASYIGDAVQYNNVNSPKSKMSINELCTIMTNMTEEYAYQRLAAVTRLALERNGEKCLEYKYGKMINILKNTSWESTAASGVRQRIFQSCNEYGFYKTSGKPDSLFGVNFPVMYFVDQCNELFGDKFNYENLQRSSKFINFFYGGLNPPTTNILYVQGSEDPWRSLCLMEPVSDKTPVLVIEGGAHASDIYEGSPEDSEALVKARVTIMQFIESLLNEI